jgi:peptide/nickel transport system substrate-binding protein
MLNHLILSTLIVTHLFVMLPADASAATKPLRYAEDRAPAIINPIFATSMSEARMNELVFEGLFTDDQELRVQPQLAQRFVLAQDKLSMVIHLRQNVKWHDGRDFTSEDVQFTINTMRNEKTASTESGRVQWIKDVQVQGPHTLTITFKAEEFAPFERLQFKIIPAHMFRDSAVSRTHTFRNHPVGTGPMMFDHYNTDNSISLRKFPGHYRSTRLDNVVMREVSDKNYQAKLLAYGSIDALVRVMPRDLSVLQANRNVELYPYQTNSWWYLGYNMQRDFAKDPNVRAALELMVDRHALLKPIGTGELLSGPFVRSSPYYNHNVSTSRPNHSLATNLMKEAGYTMVSNKWTKDGEPLTVTVTTQRDLDAALEVIVNLQTQLFNQGVTVKTAFYDKAEWRAKVWGQNDFDIILSMWSFDRNEDIYEQFHSGGSRNFGNYHNPKVDSLLEMATSARDPQEKRGILQEAHTTIAADDPMIFLWTLDSYSALSTKVHNVVIHPFYFFTWADAWYLE